MAAYLIVNVEITDAARYAQYITQEPDSIAKYHGRFLARGGKAEKLEGAWDPERVVIIEFPGSAAAKAWWASAEYSGPKALRQRAAITNMILVEGLP